MTSIPTIDAGSVDNAGSATAGPSFAFVFLDPGPLGGKGTFLNDLGGTTDSPVINNSNETFIQDQGTVSIGLTWWGGATLDLKGPGPGFFDPGGDGSLLKGNLSVGQTLFLSACGGSFSTQAEGSFVNRGEIFFTDAGNPCQAGDLSLTLPSGATLTNTGQIVSRLGLGGSRTIGGRVDNVGKGTIDVQSGTLTLGALANQDVNGHLTGGTYTLVGQLQYPGADVSTLDAALSATGAGSGLVDSTGSDGLRDLAAIDRGGTLSLLGGAATSTTGSLLNAGSLTLDASDRLMVGGAFVQQSTGRLNVGITYGASGLEAGGVDSAGSSSLAGQLLLTSSGVPGPVGDRAVVVSATAVSGAFSSVKGQRLGGGKDLVAGFSGTQVAVVIGVPALAVSPSSAPAGGVIEVAGLWFGEGETVTITLTDSAKVTTQLEQIAAGSDGTFALKVQLPATAAPGRATLTAGGNFSGISAHHSLNIT